MLRAVLFVPIPILSFVQIQLCALARYRRVFDGKLGQSFACLFGLGLGQSIIFGVFEQVGFGLGCLRAFGFFEDVFSVFGFSFGIADNRIRVGDFRLALLVRGLFDGNTVSLWSLGRGVLRIELRALGNVRLVAFFAFFKMPEVVADGDADTLERFFADAGDLFELLGSHVGQTLDGGDAGGNQLLDDAVAELG